MQNNFRSGAAIPADAAVHAAGGDRYRFR